jgi:hypothetical protein
MAKLTEAQKQANKVERKRKALEDKAFKEVGGRGSLFAELAEVPTKEQAEWHMRSVRAQMVEHLHQGPAGKGVYGLKALELFSIECHARRLLGDDLFNKLNEYARRTFDNIVGFGYVFWAGVLSGESRIVFGWQKIEDATSSIGFRCVPSDTFPAAGWVPPMTKAEFYQLFPYQEQPLAPEPETADPLFASVMERLGVTL